MFTILYRALTVSAVLAVLEPAFAADTGAREPSTAPVPLGINLAGLSYWSTEHPFANLALHASRWRRQPANAPFTWDAPLPPMTGAGYPKAVPDGSFIETFLIGTEHRDHLPKKLVVMYEGSGRINYAHGARVLERAPGRDLIADIGSERGLVVAQLAKTDPANPISAIRVYEPEMEDDPPTFRRAFLDRWSGMSALRYMDWMATNNSLERSWADRPQKDRFTQAEDGVALEYLIELSNTLQIAPWFCMPHLADDDYVRRFAEMVKSDLDPKLPVYVEYSNEVWNSQFAQAQYAAEMGRTLKLSGAPFEGQLRFYSQRTTEVLRIWEDVFAETSARIVGVYAAQAVNPWTSSVVIGWKDAHRHADVLAIAPYFGGTFGDPGRQSAIARLSPDQLIAALRKEIALENKQMIERQAEVARHANVRLVAYEGGQHLAGHLGAENNAKLTQLFQAANQHPLMKELYLEHLRNWEAAGGDLYVLFNSMGPPSKWGNWGLLETESQPPSAAPKWQAVQQYTGDAETAMDSALQ